jgi:hypothetical protein
MCCRGLHALANPISKRFSLLCLARSCTVLRSRWYQVKSGDSGLRVAGFFAIQMCQMLGGPPNRRGEAPTRDFHLRLPFPVPFTRADIHARLTHVVLTTVRRTGDYGRLWPCRTRAMHDPASGLRRIRFLRSWVNEGSPKPRMASRGGRRDLLKVQTPCAAIWRAPRRPSEPEGAPHGPPAPGRAAGRRESRSPAQPRCRRGTWDRRCRV